MSEETKKQPETEQEQAAAETKAPAAESDKQETEPAAEKTEKKDWFGKKSKELEAVKAKLEAAEQANAKLKDQDLVDRVGNTIVELLVSFSGGTQS